MRLFGYFFYHRLPRPEAGVYAEVSFLVTGFLGNREKRKENSARCLYLAFHLC